MKTQKFFSILILAFSLPYLTFPYQGSYNLSPDQSNTDYLEIDSDRKLDSSYTGTGLPSSKDCGCCITSQSAITTEIIKIEEIIQSLTNSKFPFFIDGQFSLDALLAFLDLIEEENLEELFSEKELQDVCRLLVLLAENGYLDQVDDSFDQDCDNLFTENTETKDFSYGYLNKPTDLEKAPSINNSYELLICKSWIKKKFKKAKKFVKKHKKAIIIGTVIVIAAVVGVVVGTKTASNKKPPSAPPTTSIVEKESIDDLNVPSENKETIQNRTEESKILIPDDFDFDEDYLDNDFNYASPENNNETSSTLSNSYENSYSNLNTQSSFDSNDSSIISIVEDNILDVSHEYNYLLQAIDTYQEPDSNVLDENLKYLGASIAHEILDEIAEYASIVPKLVEECRALALSLNLETTSDSQSSSSLDKFDTFRNSCHEIIDQVFATEMAESYKQESKNLLSEIGATPSIGLLPPPTGAFGFKAIKNAQGRLLPTQTSNVRGWKLGDPINNRTITGKEPKWKTVRQRCWKNEAYYNADKYKPQDLKRMKKGLAPQQINERTGMLENMELHHNPAQRDGGLYDIEAVWPDEHAQIDKYRKVKK